MVLKIETPYTPFSGLNIHPLLENEKSDFMRYLPEENRGS